MIKIPATPASFTVEQKAFLELLKKAIKELQTKVGEDSISSREQRQVNENYKLFSSL